MMSEGKLLSQENTKKKYSKSKTCQSFHYRGGPLPTLNMPKTSLVQMWLNLVVVDAYKGSSNDGKIRMGVEASY